MTLRVLAVEDSPTQAAKLLDALQTAGHEVREARSGDEALRVLAAESVDLVVSDVMMPGNVDGYALCQRIKAERPGVPVILLTSLSDPLDIIRGLEAGADNFLTKPYAPEHLNERIQVLMATRRDRDRSRVQTGVTVYFMGRHFTITSEREQILDLLVSTFEDAVRQNRELRQREEDLSRSRERLAGMYQMAVGLNSCTTEQEVIDTALDRAVSLPRVRAAWIFLGSKEEDLRLAGARNLPAGVAVPGALDGTCRCQQMLMAGELDTATRIIECERLKAVEHAPGGLHQHASVPLRCGGRCLGVMNLLGEGEGFFDEDDRTILYGIGNQIAFATERARMWTHLETLVEERTAALRQSEERYRTLVDAVSDGFFMTDERGVITFANPALAAMCGLAAASLLEGRALADFLPMSMRETVMEKLLSSASSASPSDLITAPLVRSDASEAIAEIRATSILSDGSLVGTRGVIRDVTERVRAQEALLLSSSILERIGNLVLVADREGLIRYASPSLETLLGYRPAEALGAGWWQLPWAEAEERER